VSVVRFRPWAPINSTRKKLSAFGPSVTRHIFGTPVPEATVATITKTPPEHVEGGRTQTPVAGDHQDLSHQG
ncbi:MAG: hypothetical protein R3E46_18730, partial [Sedimenticolaceae bacterium]